MAVMGELVAPILLVQWDTVAVAVAATPAPVSAVEVEPAVEVAVVRRMLPPKMEPVVFPAEGGLLIPMVHPVPAVLKDTAVLVARVICITVVAAAGISAPALMEG